MFRRIQLNTWSIVSFAALLGILWVFLAPSQIGGPVTYVLVNGNSMEPDYQKGDFILARKQSEYSVEDAIVYNHPNIGPVFHRIVGQDGTEFILKGDNNDWIDSHKPTSEEIFGKLWVHLPSAGNIITKLRTPLYLVLFSLLIAGLIVASVFAIRSNLPKHYLRKHMKRKKRINPSEVGSQGDRLETLLVIGVFLLASLVLGAFAFARPINLKVADDIQYTHTGELSYSAPDTEDIYDAEEIQTGEPVFLELACNVDLEYKYKLTILSGESLPASNFHGSASVLVRVSDPNGWNRTLQLMPSSTFSGRQVTLRTGLNLCEVQDLIAHMETVTGVGNRQYNLAFLPEISIQGEVDGSLMQSDFAPVIVFQLDSLLMKVSANGEESPLTPSEMGLISRFSDKPNTLAILGLSIPVLSARWVAAVSFLLTLSLGYWSAWPVYQDWQKGDAARIQIQYSPLLIDIREESLTSGSNHFVEVVSFRELSKLAERYGSVILHESQGHFHRYLVQDGDTVYRYALDGADPDAIFPNFSEFRYALRQAVAGQELKHYYQAIVSVETEEIVGLEALLRWTHPIHGAIYPGQFIVRAEESDLINEIDDWAMKQACKQAKEWQETGVPFGRLSVNVSSHRFTQTSFIDWFRDILDDIGCDPSCLQFEINRANVVSQNETALENLHRLNEMGIHLAIDNFATAEANQINHLSRMPIHCLKIDRSVIQNPKDNPLVRAVVKMAQSLDLKVVAQGVETETQMAFVREHPIDFAQGYFLSWPAPADEVPTLLEKGVFAISEE